MPNNPLLEMSTLPDHALPFSKIKLEHFLPAVESAIAMAKQNLANIKNSKEAANFENTILALETCSEDLDLIAMVFGNLESANGSDEMMKLAPQIYQAISAFSSDLSLDPVLFSKVKEVDSKKSELKLNAEQTQLLERTFKNFVRNGALLADDKKEQIRKIDQELAGLAPQFSENVLKATNSFEHWVSDTKELKGLPDGAIEAASLAAKSKGRPAEWLFSLQYPSYFPVATYAESRTFREKLWRAYGSKAYKDAFDNQQIIKKIVSLRNERALLLGYKTHAEFVLSDRMAQNPGTVSKFLDKLLKASKPTALKEFDEVKQLAEKIDGIKELQPWDFSYYSEKLKESKYSLNSEELRPYFKLENVVSGVFAHAQKLYGLTFKENKEVEPYHPEVKVYDILDEKSGQYLGLFYTDFFPRDTKKGGAWMTSYREQGLFKGKVRRPHISIVCNFTKPTETKPSLLTYDEVKTLFHEFGHALHGMLSQCTYRSLAGTNVYWDFVELPSQIMENWVGEKEGLDIFAKHYKTGEPIPADLVAKIKRAEKFQSGWNCLRQVQFATLDLAWHTTDPTKISDIDQFETVAIANIRIFPKIEGQNSSCSFSHIFAGGYSAGYYSYKWAEVLDADAFEYFIEKGLFSTEVANKFKENILQRGGTEHPMELYKKFRGREPDPDALLRRDGLLA